MGATSSKSSSISSTAAHSAVRCWDMLTKVGENENFRQMPPSKFDRVASGYMRLFVRLFTTTTHRAQQFGSHVQPFEMGGEPHIHGHLSSDTTFILKVNLLCPPTHSI
jgi:hypothetical protein